MEVSLDYHRPINKTIFDTFIEDRHGRELIPAKLTLPPKKVEWMESHYGMVLVHEQFSNFCFNWHYLKYKVIKVVTEIKREYSLTMEDNCIFDTSIDKAIRLPGFKLLQISSNSQI